MPPDPIYVDQTLFLGRVEEQKQFRAALKDVLAAPVGEDLPYILLLYGDGGMGKTTLAKRFRDIAQTEPPFEGEFQMLWIDWEDERRRSPALQVGREHISPETVFNVIHARSLKEDWGSHFGVYQTAVKKRGEAEKKAAAALETGGERDEFAALRGASAGALAKVLRLTLPVGEPGEKIAQAFLDVGIKVGAEQAAQLRAALENRLRARLDPGHFDLFLNPNDQLARALADGLKKIAARQPLLVFLDTYEIVDRADVWLREVMRAAGPRVVWVVGGRDNLVKSGLRGDEYFKGYAEEFPSRLLPHDMLQLAEQDIRDLFAGRAPDRVLDEEAVQVLSRATRGVPLAIDEAAEMWAKGIALADIAGEADEAAPRGQIVQKMTARYLLHAVAEADKQALFALALARGDLEILRAMLRPADETPFDLDALLRRLERDYASVHYEHARLHDEPAFFLREYLRDEKRRTEDRMKLLNRRAAEALRARLKKYETNLPRLEDRCDDEDWVKAALDLTESLFWLDEDEAWHWLVPRFVESLAYSRELRSGLAQTANDWEKRLSKSGQKRVKVLSGGEGLFASSEEHADLLDELTRVENLGWLKGEGEAECGAILDWQRGLLLYAREKYAEALARYERAECALPKNGEVLKKRLGEAFEEVGWELGYRESSGGYDVLLVEIAERAYSKAIDCGQTTNCYRRLGRIQLSLGKLEAALKSHQKSIEIEPDDALNRVALGEVYAHLKRYDEAQAAYERAIALDPKDAHPHYRLGDVYFDLKRYDEAQAAYERAIALDPKDAYPHHGLGNVYANLGHYDEAQAAFQRAITLDPKGAYPHNGLGNVYRILGRYDEALAAYQRAIALDPKFGHPHHGLGVLYQLLGQYESAYREYQAAVELAPESGMIRSSLVGILRKLGRESEAAEQIKIVRELIAKEDEYNRACFEAICGNVDEALALLKVALEKKLAPVEWARRDPDFDPIRSDARFRALVGEELAR